MRIRKCDYRTMLGGILILWCCVCACESTDMTGLPNGNSNSSNSETTGTWNSTDGLTLNEDGASLLVPPGATPSNPDITLKPIAADQMLPDGIDADDGFDAGVELGPDGTTFTAPVTVTVTLENPTQLPTLPVLLFDETTGQWGWAGIDAVITDGRTATFEIEHFSSYRPWNPPPPPGDLPIGEDDIISGTGFFSGQPFNTLPDPEAAQASLAYSPFGDVFGLSLMQVEVTNPMTGDFITLAAGLHASQVIALETARVGLVTPAGALSGPSLFEDGGQPKGVSGIMYLRKSATQWMVDVFCAYEGGIIFGQASGDL